MKRNNKLQTILLAIALLTIICAAAGADAASVSHEIGIVILPIKMLEVKSNWRTDSVSTTESGATLATATTTYGVTSTVENTMIQATLASPLPEGAVVKLRMRTGIGTSLGWVELNGGMLANLVSGARGAEYNVVEMEVTIPAGTPVNSAPIIIAYLID